MKMLSSLKIIPVLTFTDGFFSYNHVGTATTTAKLNKHTPNKSAQSSPHKFKLSTLIPCNMKIKMNWMLITINTMNPII